MDGKMGLPQFYTKAFEHVTSAGLSTGLSSKYYPLPIVDLAKGPKKKCCKKYKKKGKKRCSRCPGRFYN